MSCVCVCLCEFMCIYEIGVNIYVSSISHIYLSFGRSISLFFSENGKLSSKENEDEMSRKKHTKFLHTRLFFRILSLFSAQSSF